MQNLFLGLSWLASVCHGERNRGIVTKEGIANRPESIYVDTMPEKEHTRRVSLSIETILIFFHVKKRYLTKLSVSVDSPKSKSLGTKVVPTHFALLSSDWVRACTYAVNV
jgi:hypothetical protein